MADDHVLVKLSPRVSTTDTDAEDTLTSVDGVQRVSRIFPNAKSPQRDERILSPSGALRPKPDLTLWYQAQLTNTAEPETVVEALRQRGDVAYAEPDYLRKPVGNWHAHGMTLGLSRRSPAEILALPGPSTDPLYDQQWHLGATNVPQAWQWLEDHGYEPGGSRDLVVAVIDTGVDYTHPDLATNIWVNPAEFNGDPDVDDDGNGYVDDIHGADTVTPDGDPIDDHGHGTHVAGIIAAQANNSEGGVGIAYNTQIMVLKAAQYSGVLASSDIAEAINYAVDKGADVINMSFGGYARSQVEEDALAVAFGQAVLVGAAGNDGKVNLPCPFGRDMYPAAYNWVLGVMAHTESPNIEGDYMAGFSNFDCESQDSHEYELMAPGVDVWSTLPDGQYAAWDGTSMAAPVVSGIAALARTRWYTKSVYSSRFIMGQLATTGPLKQAYMPVEGSAVYHHVPDAYVALTIYPEPELSYLEHWLFDTEMQSDLNDDDGIVDAGETVDLGIVIRNHWGKADPVTVTLEARAEGAFQPDPYVEMITDTVSYGAVGSFNIDDNGLIYDDDGAAIGVEHPFRFTTAITTPNDHLIPFRLTMTYRNGLVPDDTLTYTTESRFYMLVQRGTEIPTIISEDMVLSSDRLWIIPDQTLVEAGVAVTVTAGTQIQFYSAEPLDPYASDPLAMLVVQGSLRATGTLTEPVEMFLSPNYETLVTEVRESDGGLVELRYVRMDDPKVEASLVDHCYFWASDGDTGYSPNGEILPWRYWHYVEASEISASIFEELGVLKHTHVGWFGFSADRPGNIEFAGSLETSYIGQSFFRALADDAGTYSLRNNVFLNNTRLYHGSNDDYLDSRLYVRNTTDGVCDGEQVVQNNAFLNQNLNMDPTQWFRVWYEDPPSPGAKAACLSNNYWGTASTDVIEATIWDFYDDFDLKEIVYSPTLTVPSASTYPFVVDVSLRTKSESGTSIVGAETVTFTVSFNRNMTTTVQPQVSFGPDEPYTDYSVDGDWTDPRTWVGTVDITPVTGDGYQFMRIAGAVAADDPWLVTGDDTERFRFEVITSGSEAMNLQATGSEGAVDLMWTQDDFDLLSGFNLYRSTSISGTYTRLNESIILPDQRIYQDTNVQPGQPYYYYFTVVKSDMTESAPSNTAMGTPVDTAAPVISHTPIVEAPPGMPLTLYADVTDNVAVQEVTLYFRSIGTTDYLSKTMVNTNGNRYSATLEGSRMHSPGLDYYIEASDGVSTARHGRPAYPHQVLVEDAPVITTVTPNHGPASGGTAVTLSGSNFKDGATITLGGAVAENVTVVSSTQITCTTPAHYPAVVDVQVTNPDTQSDTLLQSFTYESDVVSLSMPDTGGGQHDILQVPISAADVQGLGAASLTVSFNSSILSARGASNGNLTPGWSVEANTGTSGEIKITMAGSGSTTTGSGALAYVEFEVLGTPGDTSALALTDISLNDGAIQVASTDGSFVVSLVYDISGTVRFWRDSTGISNTLLTLAGDRLYAGVSDADGQYVVSGAESDDYTLKPEKSNEANGISAYDASLALQHDAGLITLSGYEVTAADVNKNGSVTAMDAFYILEQAAGLSVLPFQGAGQVWTFSPAERTYTNLSGDVTGQDFTAVLIGDPSGNWAPTRSMRALHANENAILQIKDASPDSSGAVTTTVWLDPQGAAVHGIDLTISYDGTAITPETVKLGALAANWVAAANLNDPGQIRVSIAGTHPITEIGPILTLNAQLGADVTATILELSQGDLDEGTIAATLLGGRISGEQMIYLPLVLDAR